MIFLLIFVCTAAIAWQAKLLDENYQQVFKEAGFVIPRSLDEASVWKLRAEAPAYTRNNVLRDYQDGGTLPPTYSDKYGWIVVTQSYCTKNSAWIGVEYIVNGQIWERLEIPVSKNDHESWVGSAETKAVRFETYCDPYAESVYFTTELIQK